MSARERGRAERPPVATHSRKTLVAVTPEGDQTRQAVPLGHHCVDTDQLTAVLGAELTGWMQRWCIDAADFRDFIDEVHTVMQFDSIVADDRRVVTTTIPAPARRELTAIIAAAANLPVKAEEP